MAFSRHGELRVDQLVADGHLEGAALAPRVGAGGNLDLGAKLVQEKGTEGGSKLCVASSRAVLDCDGQTVAVAVVVNGDVIVVVRRTAALGAAGHASLGFVVHVVRHELLRGQQLGDGLDELSLILGK